MCEFDIENFVAKIYTEFSNSAKRREELKECFAFYETEYHDMVRNVPTRWLSLFAAVDRILKSWLPLKRYFIALGEENCPPAVWRVLCDQREQLAPESQPTYHELYIYFIHHFMSNFQNMLLLFQKSTIAVYDLHENFSLFLTSLEKNLSDNFFGMTVKFALSQEYLDSHLKQKFIGEATKVYERALQYLKTWFPFDNRFYKAAKCLNLAKNHTLTLDQVLDVWEFLPSNDDIPPDSLYDEIVSLNQVINSAVAEEPALDTIDLWKKFFNNHSAPNLLKVVQYVLSIPVSNAGVERIFSVMSFVWSDDRNRLNVESVRSELCIVFNIPYTCTEFKQNIQKNSKILKAVAANAKYNKK